MAAGPISERNQDATIYVGGLDEKVWTQCFDYTQICCQVNEAFL